jgi:hypothetical protein
MKKVNELFDLSKVNINLNGYYLDANLDMYSTKRGVVPNKILNPVGVFTKQGVVMSYPTLVNLLKDRYTAYGADWYAWWNKIDRQLIETPVNIKGQFVIAVIENGIPKFSSNPKVHTTKDSAIAEVQRLATENPNKHFGYFECKGVARAAALTWI